MSKQSNLVNSSQDVTVDSSGNVGIGTSSPSSALHLHGAAPALTIKDNRSKTWVSGESLGSINFDSSDVSNSTTTQAKIEAITDDGSSGTYAALAFSTSTPQAISERMRIDSAGRVTMPYQPCFSAYGHGLQGWNSGSTVSKIISLNNVAHNVGGHFNTSTYRFTAPVAGNYFFSAKATQNGSAPGPSLFLFKNGSMFGFEMAIGYYTAYHSFGGEIIIPLAVNDYVDMRITNNNNASMNIDRSRSSLSGFLIG